MSTLFGVDDPLCCHMLATQNDFRYCYHWLLYHLTNPDLTETPFSSFYFLWLCLTYSSCSSESLSPFLTSPFQLCIILLGHSLPCLQVWTHCPSLELFSFFMPLHAILHSLFITWLAQLLGLVRTSHMIILYIYSEAEYWRWENIHYVLTRLQGKVIAYKSHLFTVRIWFL